MTRSTSTHARPVPAFAPLLLWVDCLGAALVGGVVVTLSEWLSRLEGLPQEVLLFTGAVNLLYAAYSFSLAIQPARSLRRLKLLVVANAAWAPVCLGLLIAFSATATPLAYVHIGGEGVYVAGLAALEWRYREVLASAA